jgi:hypothetical protein
MCSTSSTFKKVLSLFGFYYHDPDRVRVVVIKTEESWGTIGRDENGGVCSS